LFAFPLPLDTIPGMGKCKSLNSKDQASKSSDLNSLNFELVQGLEIGI
jgi:hypothetical protein